MAKRHRWYERLFFGLQLQEKSCFKLVIGLLLAIFFIQFILTISPVRKKLVLMERLEGEPVKIYKSLKYK